MSGAFRMAAVAGFLLSSMLTAGAQDQPEVFVPGNGVSAPVLLREVKPQYTPEAQAAGIEGEVQGQALSLQPQAATV